ncbi:MAG TPA: hypothetical protein VJR29_02335 [bacterium]|nr:hypothetical protein [bacterium]
MGLFLPILLFAGAAAISVLAEGCGGSGHSPASAPPMPQGFPKTFLDYGDGPEPRANGYHYLLQNLESQALSSPTRRLDLQALLRNSGAGASWLQVFQDPRQVGKAKEFIRHLATHDQSKDDVSLFDVYFETKHLGEEWKEEWRDKILGWDFRLSQPERIRVLGQPLLGGGIDPKPARELLDSLAFYIGLMNPATQPASRLTPLVDFYLKQSEPPIFARYLNMTYSGFLQLGPIQQSEAFEKAVKAKFPDAATAASLFSYLSPEEAQRFIKECLRQDPKASLDLFEKVPSPIGAALNKVFDESDYFPNLAQGTPYAKRQQQIDAFLPQPDKTWIRGQVTLKKYFWPGDTEVFSLEAKKPGPTTLVFSPHFDEPNPRKVFHWLKDLPLQSGRILFLPEANRAMAAAGHTTRLMNNEFNKAFQGDRIDQIIVRRTEWLLGLCDGMIGLHDWTEHSPFFISDVVIDADGVADPSLGPVASLWLPAQVRKIQRLSHPTTLEKEMGPSEQPAAVAAAFKNGLQVPWQIADYAATRLAKLSGGSFEFSASPLARRDSRRIDNATAYMNFFLRKPAMTFEGTREEEHGQLEAQAVYALLLGFGHKIDPAFEKKLKDPNPTVEPDIYVGLPPVPPPAPSPAP